METDYKEILLELNELCCELGKNEKLVQAAGGNASVKNDNILLIKSSGTRLADAKINNIFVDVNLYKLQESMNKNNFSDPIPILTGSSGKASIETHLHSLLPHKFVIHLHMVEAVQELIKPNWRETISKKLGNQFNWCGVDYFKPGPTLAKAVKSAINSKKIDIVFLANHGVFFGANNVNLLRDLIYSIQELLDISLPEVVKQKRYKKNTDAYNKIFKENFQRTSNPSIDELALNTNMFRHIQENWAFCPDHVVFLGARPFIVKNQSINVTNLIDVPFIFVPDVGVYQNKQLSRSQYEQILFFYNVFRYIKPGEDINILDINQINELLNWDAEKFRKNIQS